MSHPRLRPPGGGATRPLILTQSPSAAGLIRQITREATPRPLVAGWYDALSFGPLPPLDDLEAYCRTRAGFWVAIYLDDQEPPSAEAEDFQIDIEDLTALLAEAPEAEVWLGTALADQVFAAFLMALCRRAVLDPAAISLRQFAVDHLGMFRPEHLAGLPNSAPDPGARTIYLTAWDALVAPDPADLDGLIAQGTGLPVLDAALAVFARRYPDAETGLGSLDRAILACAPPEWTGAMRVVGYAMVHLWDEGDPIGDGIIFARMKALAAGPQPCLELRGPGNDRRKAEVRLTAFGADCLAGRASRLPRGIDDRLGGVHLSSAEGRVWVWRGGMIQPA